MLKEILKKSLSRKGSKMKLSHILLTATLTSVLMTGCTRCTGPGSSPTPPPAPATPVLTPNNLPTVSELKIEDTKPGKGPEAANGMHVTVHYTGTLMDGTKFDSSLDRNQPFTFVLGAGQVIKGWDLGVAGMKRGGKRRLKIPGHLAYGERGAGAIIPPNASLVFDIELLEMKK